MKFKGAASIAVLMSGALLLGACTSDQSTSGGQSTAASGKGTTGATTKAPAGDEKDPCLHKLGITAPKEGSVSYTAGKPDWSGYNGVTADTYSTYNSVINAMMGSGFTYYGVDGTLCRDTDFGTFEVKSENPLIVEYTISDKAVWSDGTPITINDFLLDWAAQNPEFLVPGFANKKDPKAKPVFNHVSSSLAEKVPEGPKGEVGSKKFTVEYASPDPDYQIQITGALPAHVVAKQSGLTPEALAKAILARDAETVKKAAKFWNEGWLFSPGQLPADLSIVPSSGPYMLKAGGWQKGNSLTLTQNEKYWGEPPATKEITFRFLDDSTMPQALQNGEVMVVSPQPTVDTVPALKQMQGIDVKQYSVMTWEHLDFNFAEGHVTQNPKIREALAYCIPRQEIVDKLIKPINDKAVVMNLREVFPFQEAKYKEVLSAAYDGRYDKVDIEKSKAAVKASGVAGPVKVKIGFNMPNPRRQSTVELIQASCKQAGIEIVNGGSDKFFEKDLRAGDWDMALFAWAGSGQVTAGQNQSGTNMQQNAGKYSNKVVDDAWKKVISSLDQKVHTEQVKVIEKTLWSDLFSIPLYAHPGITASDSRLQNVRPTATQSQISWNAQQWRLAS